MIALPALTADDDVAAADAVVASIAATLNPDTFVACALARDVAGAAAHCAVLISSDGVVLEQPLLHRTERYSWSATADAVRNLDTPYGKVAVLCGDDAMVPETMEAVAAQKTIWKNQSDPAA